MYDHNSHAAFHRLSLEQQVRLEKHQEMIQNTLHWQQMSKQLHVEPQTKTSPRLVALLATLLNLLTH